jgi:hypothetical protein
MSLIQVCTEQIHEVLLPVMKTSSSMSAVESNVKIALNNLLAPTKTRLGRLAMFPRSA